MGWRSDPSPGGAWPPPSPLGEGGLISNLLPGEKVLRYEADEGSLGSKPRLSTRAPKCLLKKQEMTSLQCRAERRSAMGRAPSSQPQLNGGLASREKPTDRKGRCGDSVARYSLFFHPGSRSGPFSPKAPSRAQSGCQRPKEIRDGDDQLCEIRRSVEPAFSDESAPLALLRGVIREFGCQADGFGNNFRSPIGKCFGDSLTEGQPVKVELPG